jgi:DNA-directed RNA polymerase specialized sigma24 family protein
MNINKEEFNKKFIEKGWIGVAEEIKALATYIAGRTFELKGEELEDAVQEAWIYSYKKKDKCNKAAAKGTFNPWSFFWTNSYFQIADILRKQKRRKDIAHIVSFDAMEIGEREAMANKIIRYI